MGTLMPGSESVYAYVRVADTARPTHGASPRRSCRSRSRELQPTRSASSSRTRSWRGSGSRHSRSP